jgi:thymidine kinase
MSKLYFRYGAMNSAKTLNLIAVAHNYRTQGKSIAILKPKLDTRFSATEVHSRAGLSVSCDYLVESPNGLKEYFLSCPSNISCVLVDEAQFLDPECVNVLRLFSIKNHVPVICYGLRTDFKTNMFPGAKRLMEIADSIEEVKTTCHNCNRKAIFNLRIRDGHMMSEGSQIELGSEDIYRSTCANCWYDMIIAR